jgi:glutamine amidotransferase
MCRWLAYTGEPIHLEELVIRPKHSLIDQSLASRRGEVTTNGDGFGVGWYGDREFPGVFKEIRPAWNDRNLKDLAAQIRSGLFFAHVRASTGTEIQRSNCHPFRHRRWLLVHNGEVRSFRKVKRDLAFGVAPELFFEIEGTTDSEILFYLSLGFGLDDEPVAALERTAGFIEAVGRRHGVEEPLNMTLGVSDGRRLFAVRYASDGHPPTLYLSRGSEALRELHPDSHRFPSGARAVVSEPLTDLTDLWHEIEPSTVVTIEGGTMNRQPFAPQPPAGGD